MKGKKIKVVNTGLTEDIKDDSIFDWTPKKVTLSKPVTLTIDQIDNFDIVIRCDASGRTIDGTQYIYMESCLQVLSNDPHISRDGRCLTEEAKKEGWYFVKMVSTMPTLNPLMLENDQIFRDLENVKEVDQEEIEKLKSLNKSGDNENISLANAILTRKYGSLLDIQQREVRRQHDS